MPHTEMWVKTPFCSSRFGTIFVTIISKSLSFEITPPFCCRPDKVLLFFYHVHLLQASSREHSAFLLSTDPRKTGSYLHGRSVGVPSFIRHKIEAKSAATKQKRRLLRHLLLLHGPSRGIEDGRRTDMMEASASKDPPGVPPSQRTHTLAKKIFLPTHASQSPDGWRRQWE